MGTDSSYHGQRQKQLPDRLFLTLVFIDAQT
jgi:hypothetical protein